MLCYNSEDSVGFVYGGEKWEGGAVCCCQAGFEGEWRYF